MKEARKCYDTRQRELLDFFEFQQEYGNKVFTSQDVREVIQYETIDYDENHKPFTKNYTFPIVAIGAMKFLLSDDFKIFDIHDKGYHSINLANNEAKIGATIYNFVQHLHMIEQGKAEGFIFN